MTEPPPGRLSTVKGWYQRFGQALGDEARVDVGRTAGGERHDDAHRPRGGSPARGRRDDAGSGKAGEAGGGAAWNVIPESPGGR